MSPRQERRDLPVLVHGATGYTGKLVARALMRRGVPFGISGRSARKLADLAADLRIPVPQIVTPEGDTTLLTETLRNVRVVINCAGPFLQLGAPVVAAAIASGSHYLDVTGEQEFVTRMHEHDRAAAAASACIVPSMAFEVALSDCAARIAAERLPDVDEIAVTYRMDRAIASGGTTRTIFLILEGKGKALENGQLTTVEVPGWHDVRFPGDTATYSGFDIPGAEIVTIPRHTKLKRLHAYMSNGGPITTWITRKLLPHAPSLMSSAPAGWVRKHFEAQPTGSGPADADRATHRWRIAVEAKSPTGAASVFLAGPDPYGLTATIAVKGAQLMLAPDFSAKGVLSPAQAFDASAFLESLKEDGVRLSQ